MTRYLSAAGLAVYLIALSTAFPSVQDAWKALGGLVPAAVAAEAGAVTAPADANADAAAEGAGPDSVASTASEWHGDRDGMLMDGAGADEPFAVLNPV